MEAIAVIAIFDVGKTNKKTFLFDERYKIVYEKTDQFPQTTDEDGDPCEDLDLLTKWCLDAFANLSTMSAYSVKAINFSAYGASFVHINTDGKPILPLYNYLKNYPKALKENFFREYGGEQSVSKSTASPVLDSLNSGLQLYRLKYEKRLLSSHGYSLHLPQYLSYLITKQVYSDITSIGCHTMLWDFTKQRYHEWIAKEGIQERLAPLFACDEVITQNGIVTGVGLHDSSAALIPYLAAFHQPFILISTGTWCISLNPFNECPLTAEELEKDCLCYMTYQGMPVKASRLFAGQEHELQIKLLAAHFNKQNNYYETVYYNQETIKYLKNTFVTEADAIFSPGPSAFERRNVGAFRNYEEAYHQLIMDIIHQQVQSTQLIMQGKTVKRLFVDGGFSKNPIYMNLLAVFFPEVEVYAASVAQATAMGAALSVHRHWNKRDIPADLIDLKYYASAQ